MEEKFDPDAFLADSGDDFDPDAFLSEGQQELTPVKDFARSMFMGSSIGENIPGGKQLADVGSKIGSAISAGVMAPFSEKNFGELYDEGQAAMAKADAERAAIDQASPVAQGTKEVLANLAFVPARAGGPAKEVIRTGQFRYPGDTRTEKLKMYLQQKFANVPPGAMQAAKEVGEDLLPLPARLMLRLSRKFGSGSP